MRRPSQEILHGIQVPNGLVHDALPYTQDHIVEPGQGDLAYVHQ